MKIIISKICASEELYFGISIPSSRTFKHRNIDIVHMHHDYYISDMSKKETFAAC